MKWFWRQSAAVVLAVFVLLSGGITALANSAPRQTSGSDANGPVLVDEESPLVVEREHLVFHINTLPEWDFGNVQTFLDYDASVTAEYTFYNPTDTTVTATLLFPFGTPPSYDEGYTGTNAPAYHADTEKFDITVNGQNVTKRLRHSLAGPEGFALETGMAKLWDGFVEHVFFSPELPVTQYTVTVSGLREELLFYARTEIPAGESDGRYYFPERNGTVIYEDHLQLRKSVKNGQSFTYYVLGEELPVPEWTLWGKEELKQVEGSVTVTSTGTMSFRELALSLWGPWTAESGVSEEDWYNAVVALFEEGTEAHVGLPVVHAYHREDDPLDRSMLRWYEYEISVGAGERVVNTVSAPMYPGIDKDREPCVYDYTYLLSPAMTWAEFGELHMEIRTPYYLLESRPDGFERTTEGYALNLPGLPEGELTFTLSESEAPTARVEESSIWDMLTFFALPIGLLCFLCIIVTFVFRKRET